MKSSELTKGTWYRMQYPAESSRWNKEWSTNNKELGYGIYLGPDPEKKGWHLVTRHYRKTFWLDDCPQEDGSTKRVMVYDLTNEQFPVSISSKAILEECDTPWTPEQMAEVEVWRALRLKQDFATELRQAEIEALQERMEALIGVYDAEDPDESPTITYRGVVFGFTSPITRKVIEYLESELWNLDSLDNF